MPNYPLEKYMRFALATVAFAVALLMTPRALLDVTDHADSHEIPVDMLEPTDDCVWCSSIPEDFEITDCDSLDDDERHWLNPDDIAADDIPKDCREDAGSFEPSA